MGEKIIGFMVMIGWAILLGPFLLLGFHIIYLLYTLFFYGMDAALYDMY